MSTRPLRTCPVCGHEHRGATFRCSNCRQTEYRNDPVHGAERRARHAARVAAYQRANPEKRRRWRRNWLASIGYWTPDLSDLRAAIRNLDRTLARAADGEGLRGAGERGGLDGLEGRDGP